MTDEGNIETTDASASGDEEIEPQGFFDKIINLYLDPSALFNWITRKPDFWTPWLVFCLVTVILSAVSFPATSDIRWEQTEKSLIMQGKSDEDITKAGEKFHESSTQYIQFGSQAVGTFIFTPLLWALGAGILYIISLVQGMNTSFRGIISVFAYASLIKLIGDVVETIIKLATGAVSMEQWERSYISIAAILPADAHRMLIYPLSALNPFYIWSMVALVIGLKTIHRSRTRAAVVSVVIYFILVLLIRVGLGAAMQVFAGGADAGGGNITVEAG